MSKRTKFFAIVLILIMISVLFIGCKNKNSTTSTTITYKSAIKNLESYGDLVDYEERGNEWIQEAQEELGITGLTGAIIIQSQDTYGYVFFFDKDKNAKDALDKIKAHYQNEELKFERTGKVVIVSIDIKALKKYITTKYSANKNNNENDNKGNNSEEYDNAIEGSEGIEYKYLSESNSYEVSGFTTTKNSKIKVTIPSFYNDGTNGKHPVTTIGDYAFSYCDSLTSITIPDSVTSIGYTAFRGCSSLTNITIPSSVTSIGEDAFSYCYKLVEVYNKSSITINKGNYGLSYVKNIYTEEGGSKLSKEGDYVIYTEGELKELISYEGTSKEIVIPNSVTSINMAAFYYCDSLTSITIPNSVTSIGEEAFYYCDSLTSITIPSSVTTIGDYAFSECSSLTSIVIPNTVTYMGHLVFCGCYDLKIFMQLTEEPYDWEHSWYCDATAYWYSETEPTDFGNYWHYVNNTPTIW